MKIKSTIYGAFKSFFALMSVLAMASVDSDNWAIPLIGVFVFAFFAFISWMLESEVA